LSLPVPNQIQASLVRRILGVEIVAKDNRDGLPIVASINAGIPLADDRE
jgi:hypothetical protein